MHHVEQQLHAPAADILDAIQHGFRAMVDVKGKLAELYLSRILDGLKDRGVIDGYQWNDKDGLPDFEVFVGGCRVIVECKNVRDKVVRKTHDMTAELQKTRNGIDRHGNKTRAYPVTHFEVIGACTFNQTRTWTFRFNRSARLATRPSDTDLLEIYQNVPLADIDGWTSDLGLVLHEIARERTPMGVREPEQPDLL